MLENGSLLQAHKERRKQKIREEMKEKGLVIGIFAEKTNHKRECTCWSCLTAPGPFCPFPKEQKMFCDTLFAAVGKK